MFMLPLPAHFGHVGYSHSGRVRPGTSAVSATTRAGGATGLLLGRSDNSFIDTTNQQIGDTFLRISNEISTIANETTSVETLL